MHLPECKIVFYRYFLKKAQFDFESEIYTECVLFCVAEGMFQYQIGDGAPHYIHAGEIIACPAGMAFHRQMLLPSSFLMIKLDIGDCRLFSEFPLPIENQDRYMQNLSVFTKEDFFSDDNTARLLHYCMDIWYLFASQQTQKTGCPDKIIPASLQSVHQKILCYYTTELSVNILAEEAGFSTVHFINMFRKYYGYTPKQYILLLRLKKAQRLLETTSDSIQSIAHTCGFQDAFYFSRLFRQHYQMTPNSYQKLHHYSL